MAIVKLMVPGDEVTLTVAKCEKVKGKYGEQWQIEGVAAGKDVTVFINVKTSDRQWVRLGLDPETQIVGETLRFFRVSAGDGGPAAGYLNIEQAHQRDAAPKPASKRVLPPDLRDDDDPGPTPPPEVGRSEPQLPATPRETREAGEEPLDRERVVVEHMKALWKECAIFQVTLAKQYGFTPSGESINAQCANITIQLDRFSLMKPESAK